MGHVVLRVQDLERSLSFYAGVLGLREVARRDFGEGPMEFLSTGHSHHDLALVEAPAAGSGRLHHLAFKVGASLADLDDTGRALTAAGVPIHMALDHRVSQGLYVSDPDGTLVEIYVDAAGELWRTDPAVVATSVPLPVAASATI